MGALSKILVESTFHVFEKCFQPRFSLDAETATGSSLQADGIGGLGVTGSEAPGKRKEKDKALLRRK